MDRHGPARREQPERLRRPKRIEVSRADRRAPAGDGKERDVERPGERGHPVEEIRVAREVDLSRARDDEPERRRAPHGGASASVDGRGRAHGHRADRHLVADIHLADVREPPQGPARADRDDDRHVAAQEPQRRPVEVVEVDVREQDGVDLVERGHVEGHAALQVPDPAAQDGSVSRETPSSSIRTVACPT